VTNRSISIDGVNIAYDDVGEGRPVVVLHGFTGDTTTVVDLADRLAEASGPGRNRRMTIDFVGHGNSDSPADGDAYTMSAHVEQVRRVIETHGKGPVDLVGYSMGSRVALSLAIAHPELVRSMSLISPSPGLATESERRKRVVADMKLAHQLLVEGLEPFIDYWMGLPMWDSLKTALGPEGWDASRKQRLTGDASGLAASLIGCSTGAMPALHDHLAQLSMPVQLVVGEHDAKFRAIASEMASAIPNCRVAPAGGAGHAVHLERPDATAGAITKFMGR